jgi:hypothetical protein
MLRSAKFTRLFAVMALLAWSNVQAMACCWAMLDETSVEKIEVQATSSTAEDHSCCPGGEAKTTSDQPVSAPSSQEDCGMTQGGAALCCTHSDSAEDVTAFSPQFSFAHLALIAYLLPAHPVEPPQAAPPPPTLASSGPPRYLALERILI